MRVLHLRLLGNFAVLGQNNEDITPSSRKLSGLLACLALPPGTPRSRERLASMFWGESGEARARASLRQALTILRQDLGPETPILADRGGVALDPAGVTVDAMEFESAAAGGDFETAGELYRGDLLEGLIVDDSEFHDWLIVERTRLRDIAVGMLSRQIEQLAGGAAILTCQRLLQIDSTREDAHRRLMVLYAEQDQRALALRQFQICRDALQREFGTNPDRETEALFQQLQQQSNPLAPLPPAATPAAGPHAGGLSIAVLPFINIGDDPRQEHFADGIVENILTNLSRFRDLSVIARNSTFAYKGRAVKIQELSKSLGARYVLEGSVQRSGDRVRVTAQLIDGTTGSHLWAQHYDRQLGDVLAVQDEVTETIVGTLATAFGGRLHKAWRGRWEAGKGEDFQAFDVFTQAVEIFDRFTKEDVQRARDLFTKAIILDPNYGKAIAKLAWTHTIDAVFGFSDDLGQSWSNARKFARLAVERDDDEAWGHWAKGGYCLYQGQQDRAIAELTKALELNPNDADPMSDFAMILSYAGETGKAIEWAHKAMRLNPHSPDWYWMQLGQIYFDARRYKDAVGAYENLRSLETIWIDLYLAASNMALGRAGAAQISIERALKLKPSATVERWITPERTPYRNPEDREHLRTSLLRAGLPEI